MAGLEVVMRLVSIVVLGLVALGGCAKTRVVVPRPEVALIGTAWTVERIDDTDAAGAYSTVRFEDGRVSGRAGCNQYSGYLQAAGDALRVSETRTTRMACPPPVMEQESRLLSALAAVRTARREGDRLVLLDEGGRVRLRLAQLPATGPAGPARRARVYACADGPALAVTEADDDTIDVFLPDGRRRLPRVPAASGARYTDGQVSVWNKGSEVLLERDGRAWQCTENEPRSPR
jgi:putative lipoprotein